MSTSRHRLYAHATSTTSSESSLVPPVVDSDEPQIAQVEQAVRPTLNPLSVFEPEPSVMKQRVINGLLLGASFGYAMYTIFNIDHGMTRGWTQSVSHRDGRANANESHAPATGGCHANPD